ncbi:SDR family NAD(P)-dependent oxidoreductase [Rhodococcus qingshengii]|uniref:SDR family NAD(P)-dependent oxidoreductase n=1 Tax=Rhodococcus qingshengii TaxID=334542 RepID=UPI0036D85022
MVGRLEGKVALITGTGGGQGRTAALRFAQEGAIIVGCDLKTSGAEETVEMVRSAGGEMSSTQPVDLGDPEAVTAWIDAAAATHGRLDILYNNASAPQFGSITDMTDAQWHSNVRNELDLVFYACRAAWPHLAAAEQSSIINIASTHGINALRPSPGGFAHAATKHAVIGMTRELANDGGPVGIRVNSISPGFILTAATKFLEEVPGGIEAHLDHQIIKRAGSEEDVVATALFLASEDASFITGQNIVVDGGYTIV